MPIRSPRSPLGRSGGSSLRDRGAYVAAALALLPLAAAAPALAVSGGRQAAAAKPPATRPLNRSDLNGYWVVTNFVTHDKPVDARITHTVDGDLPPLRPEAQAIYDKKIANERQGIVIGDTDSMCVGPGVPRMMRGPGYPVYIFQPPGMVVLNFEILHNVRWIYLNARHPPAEDLDNNWQGDSIAHWEGDTLVVDTVGLSGKTTLDKVGLPTSDDLHVVERIRMTGHDNFEDLITIDDPKTYTRTWSVKATYKRMPPGTRIGEYVCENNRNAPAANGAVSFDLKK